MPSGHQDVSDASRGVSSAGTSPATSSARLAIVLLPIIFRTAMLTSKFFRNQSRIPTETKESRPRSLLRFAMSSSSGIVTSDTLRSWDAKAPKMRSVWAELGRDTRLTFDNLLQFLPTLASFEHIRQRFSHSLLSSFITLNLIDNKVCEFWIRGPHRGFS